MSKPRNVRIIRPDGPPIDCSEHLICTGTRDGIENWMINYPFRGGVDRLESGLVLPARTSISFSAAIDPAQMGDKIVFMSPRHRWFDRLRRKLRR